MCFCYDRGSLSQRGLAMPMALLLILFVSAITAIYLILATSAARSIATNSSSNRIFFAAEGILSAAAQEVVSKGILWSSKTPHVTKPLGYKTFDPRDPLNVNGLPVCSGVACTRNFVPVGGGILKNVGPIADNGETVVDPKGRVDEQLSLLSPSPDVVLAGTKGWYQVEGLGDSPYVMDEVGNSLNNNAATTPPKMFRITAISRRDLGGVQAERVLVGLLELIL